MNAEKTVILGVTGGIAVYKAVEVASHLTRRGIRVKTVMTDAACEFVRPLTFRTVTRQPVATDAFAPVEDFKMGHISLAEEADLVVIAPATANTIAKLACGLADNLLTATVLATEAPVIVAPAMNDNMWKNPVTQENVTRLVARGFTIIEPVEGLLASGKTGVGRLPEPAIILGHIYRALGSTGDLAGRRIVITAGGTREAIDPVRHVGNRSSGRMGYALAEAARDRGAGVTLIAAPTGLADPAGIETVHVESAAEMHTAVSKAVRGADALVMAAAVADYHPRQAAKQKLKKSRAELTLELVRTPDILGEVEGKFLRIGFAAESENLAENARAKLAAKKLDLIVANDISAADSGFDVDTNRIVIIDRQGEAEELPLLAKREAADRVLDRVCKLLK